MKFYLSSLLVFLCCSFFVFSQPVPVNHNGDTLWVHPTDNSSGIEWGSLGTNISAGNGAESDINGYANTKAIITEIDSGAAYLCDTLTALGYSDWYLPAKDELDTLYQNQDSIGGFSSADYWSSTEFDDSNACYQNFSNGYQDSLNSKLNPNGVRCVRRDSQFNHITISLDTIIDISCDTCSDGEIVINVSGGDGLYNYKWSNGLSTKNCTGISSTGYYTVTVTDSSFGYAVDSFYVRRHDDKNYSMYAGTYLGGATEGNEPVNIGIGANSQLFIAGNFSGVEGQKHPDYNSTSLNEANDTSRGKIIVLNSTGDTIVQSINLGETIYDYEIQNRTPYRMAVIGSWGVSCLDSAGNELWTKDTSNFGSTGAELNIDIDDLGNVAVLNPNDKKWWIIDKNGNIKNPSGNTTNASTSTGIKGDVYNTGSDYVTDIAILNDTVFVGGFNNDNLSGADICGTTSGLPVQSNFIRAFANTGGGNYEFIWRTWDIQGGYLGLDQSDSWIYEINVGKDDKLYVLGEQANANGVFRWDGKTSVELEAMEHEECNQDDNYGTATYTVIDRWNSLWGFCAAVHIGYFCAIDPSDGWVERGQFVASIARNCKNSFRTRDGYIHADEEGNVYIGGVSAYSIKDRDSIRINGVAVGEYDRGDASFMVVKNNFMERKKWMTFAKDSNKGTITGIAIRDSIHAIAGTSKEGNMITGGTRTNWDQTHAVNASPFYPDDAGKNDAWIGVFNSAREKDSVIVGFSKENIFPQNSSKNKAIELKIRPNPVKEQFNIAFSIPKTSFVDVALYQTTGTKLDNIVNKVMKEGKHQLQYDASSLSPGVYYLKLNSGNSRKVKKIVIQ